MATARLKPVEIVAKKYGRFIHEVVTPKEAFPKGTKFRYVATDGHRVLIGYWGKPIAGKHPYYKVQKILHPKKRGEPCKLKDRLRLKEVKELVYGRAYGVRGELPKLTGRRRGRKLRVKKNPRALWYVGFPIDDGIGVVFRYYKEPTRASHGHLYKFVTGPFKTEREAIVYRNMMALA